MKYNLLGFLGILITYYSSGFCSNLIYNYILRTQDMDLFIMFFIFPWVGVLFVIHIMIFFISASFLLIGKP